MIPWSSERLLDTDTLSEYYRGRNAKVRGAGDHYFALHGRFTFSAATRYEVLRGLYHLGAAKRVGEFKLACGRDRVVPLDDAVIDTAAEVWALGRRTGKPTGDDDMLIAGTALVERLPLVTGNVSHFDWIPGLVVETWH